MAVLPNLVPLAAQLFSHKASPSARLSEKLPLAEQALLSKTPLEKNQPHRDANSKLETLLFDGNNIQPGASLSIIDARHSQNSLGEQILKIAIKSQTQETISVSDVKVQVYFYDQQGDDIIPSKAPVTSRWLHSPVEWKNGEPEILEVIYQPETVSPDLYYAGYIVAVYYKGELQSYRADPVKLTNQFPIKVFIGHNEL